MDEGKEGKSSEDEISNIKKSRVVKDKERGVEKIWGEEKKREWRAKAKIQRVQRGWQKEIAAG